MSVTGSLLSWGFRFVHGLGAIVVIATVISITATSAIYTVDAIMEWVGVTERWGVDPLGFKGSAIVGTVVGFGVGAISVAVGV